LCILRNPYIGRALLSSDSHFGSRYAVGSFVAAPGQGTRFNAARRQWPPLSSPNESRTPASHSGLQPLPTCLRYPPCLRLSPAPTRQNGMLTGPPCATVRCANPVAWPGADIIQSYNVPATVQQPPFLGAQAICGGLEMCRGHRACGTQHTSATFLGDAGASRCCARAVSEFYHR
jgi:hypothetical protein